MKLGLASLGAVLVACAAVFPGCGSGPESPCGPAIQKSPGHDWACTFADDFDGNDPRPGLAGDDDLHHGVHPGLEGVLRRQPRARPRRGRAARADGDQANGPHPLRPDHESVPERDGLQQGPLRTGLWPVRSPAKLPPGPGYQPALWMYPQDLAYGDRSGEIDLAEAFGSPDVISPHLHLRDSAGTDHPIGADCRVTGASSGFHTYAVSGNRARSHSRTTESGA